MAPEWGNLLVTTARGYVGSHYINGAYGARPGEKDGCPCRPGGVDLIKSMDRLNPTRQKDEKANLAVLAATMTVKKYCVCAGSWRTIEGGRWTDPGAWDLNNYLATLKGKPVDSWTPYFEKFTPRRAFGPGQKGEIYWGESCEYTRHFDCVGFISFCVWKTTGAIHQHEISGWRGSPNPAQARVYELKMGAPSELMDGDIIIKADHHIGFITKGGQIIEANDTDKGVTATGHFSISAPGDWTHLVRLP